MSLPVESVSRETLPSGTVMDAALTERLVIYSALLAAWNGRINLVSPGDLANLQPRHIADSLQLLPHLPATGPCADLGSGAGFPGLMLAAAAPERPWHLIESDRRKAAFLQEATRAMSLPNVKVHAIRIEAASLPPLSALTARALAPLVQLLPHAARLLAPQGVALFLKGRSAMAELTEARRTWTLTAHSLPSATDAAATILRISEIACAPGTP